MRIRHFIPLALIAVAVSVFLAFDSTQTSSARDALQRDSGQNAAGDLEEFRARLADHTAELADMYEDVIEAGGPASILGGLTEAQLLIPDLTDEDLGVLRDAISQYPAWWDLPGIVSVSSEPDARGREALGSTASLTSHPTCPAGVSLTVRIAAEIAARVAEAVNDLVNDGLTVVILGEGVTVPSPAKIITGGIYWALRTASDVPQQVQAANSECEDANHRAILHDTVGPRIDVTLSTRASQASLDTHDADIKALIGGVQTTLDTVTEMKRIHLQVVALPGQREFLITADEAGVPVNVTFIGVKYSRGDDPISFVDVLIM